MCWLALFLFLSVSTRDKRDEINIFVAGDPCRKEHPKYRLMDISARGSNRDGAALRYVAEALSKRSEAVKLLILVSDGQPADTGYYGTAAEEDLRGIKQEYQRKGILFVAAAIGNDMRFLPLRLKNGKKSASYRKKNIRGISQISVSPT